MLEALFFTEPSLILSDTAISLNPNEMSSDRQTPLAPPGYVIGTVWTGLFVCMGLARWKLVRSREGGAGSATPIVWLATLCLAYPVYTGGLRNTTVGLVGNVVTLVFAIAVAAFVFPKSRAAALLTAPIAIWLTYATFLTALSVRSL